LGRAGYVFDPGMVEHDQAGLASDGWAAIFFLYLTNIIFLEKLAREILENIRKKYWPKIIMLTILSCPKLPRTSFEN
jgi:hypothetical protein